MCVGGWLSICGVPGAQSLGSRARTGAGESQPPTCTLGSTSQPAYAATLARPNRFCVRRTVEQIARKIAGTVKCRCQSLIDI